ncbi:MAG TPA: hypothetical protein VJ803_06145 [Gemmatimonadaceae bacterium]|nr:hypothetical protein [Gemmatimonadaceae bacterium]
MNANTLSKPKREQNARDPRRQSTRRAGRFTTIWGWFTAPLFGSAGSGGLEYEPIMERR